MFIYALRHIATGREYIGKTVGPLRYRLSGHRSRANRRERYPLYEAIRSDGIAAFEMNLLATAASHEELWKLEQEFITERNTLYPNGFNLVCGGRGNYGWHMAEETRQKIAASRRGQPSSNKGRRMSEAQRVAMSRARKGKPKTPAQLAAVRSIEARARSAAIGRRNRGHRQDSAKWAHTQRRVQAAMPPEAKAIRNRKVGEAKREWWASLTGGQRIAHIQKMTEGRWAV